MPESINTAKSVPGTRQDLAESEAYQKSDETGWPERERATLAESERKPCKPLVSARGTLHERFVTGAKSAPAASHAESNREVRSRKVS